MCSLFFFKKSDRELLSRPNKTTLQIIKKFEPDNNISGKMENVIKL